MNEEKNEESMSQRELDMVEQINHNYPDVIIDKTDMFDELMHFGKYYDFTLRYVILHDPHYLADLIKAQTFHREGVMRLDDLISAFFWLWAVPNDTKKRFSEDTYNEQNDRSLRFVRSPYDKRTDDQVKSGIDSSDFFTG